MPHSVARLILVTLLCAIRTAHSEAQTQAAQTRGNPSRDFAKGTWDLLRRIGADDDLFDNPGPAAMDATRIVVFDYGTRTVKSIRLDGTLEWKSGRAGAGPGEYDNPVSLRLDDSGRAIIHDPELGRITVLDRGGKVLRTIPLKEHFEIALPGPGNSRFLLSDGGAETLVTVADTIPTFRPAAALPVDYKGAAPITRSLGGAVSTANGHLLAFGWSSRMIFVDSEGRVVRSCTGVDSLSLPPMRRMKLTVQGAEFVATKVDTAARRSTAGITAFGRHTAVLGPSVAADGSMTLDLYAPDCGRYVESRRLPLRAQTIVGNADVLVAVVAEPVPHLVVMRWKP